MNVRKILTPIREIMQGVIDTFIGVVNWVRQKAGLDAIAGKMLQVANVVLFGTQDTAQDVAVAVRAVFSSIRQDAADTIADVTSIVASARAAIAGDAGMTPGGPAQVQPISQEAVQASVDMGENLLTIEQLIGDIGRQQELANDRFLRGQLALRSVQSVAINLSTGLGNVAAASIHGFESMSEAFHRFAVSVLEDLARITAQAAILFLLGKIVPGFGLPISFAGALSTVVGGAQHGGPVGGSGIGDRQPILAERGEFVVRGAAVARFGADNLAAITRGEKPSGGGGDISMPISIQIEGDGAFLAELDSEMTRIAEETIAPTIKRLMKQRDL